MIRTIQEVMLSLHSTNMVLHLLSIRWCDTSVRYGNTIMKLLSYTKLMQFMAITIFKKSVA